MAAVSFSSYTSPPLPHPTCASAPRRTLLSILILHLPLPLRLRLRLRPRLQRSQYSELKNAHSDLLVLLASQEIEKNTLMEHLGRHGAECVQEAMKGAFEKGALDWTKLES